MIHTIQNFRYLSSGELNYLIFLDSNNKSLSDGIQSDKIPLKDKQLMYYD